MYGFIEDNEAKPVYCVGCGGAFHPQMTHLHVHDDPMDE